MAAAISLTDVAGLWYAITKFTHRNISNSHKFQAVGLGEREKANKHPERGGDVSTSKTTGVGGLCAQCAAPLNQSACISMRRIHSAFVLV